MKSNYKGHNEGSTTASSQSSYDYGRNKMKVCSLPDLTVASVANGVVSKYADSSKELLAGIYVTSAGVSPKHRRQKVASASNYDSATLFRECKTKISDIREADFFDQIVKSTLQNLTMVHKPLKHEERPYCKSPRRSPKPNDNIGKKGGRSSDSVFLPPTVHSNVGMPSGHRQLCELVLEPQALETCTKRSQSTGGRLNQLSARSEKRKEKSAESFRYRVHRNYVRKVRSSEMLDEGSSPEPSANIASVKHKLRMPASGSMLVDLAISSKANLDIFFNTGSSSPERSANVASVKPKLRRAASGSMLFDLATASKANSVISNGRTSPEGSANVASDKPKHRRPASGSMLVDLAISSNVNLDINNGMPALNQQKVFTKGARSNNKSPNSSVSNRRRRGNSPTRVGREQVLQALKHNVPPTVLSVDLIVGDEYEDEGIDECHDDKEKLPWFKNTSELGELHDTKTRRFALLCKANATVSQLKLNDGNTSTSRLDLALLESLERRSKYSLGPRLNNDRSLQKQPMLKSAPNLSSLKTSKPSLRSSLSRRLDAKLTSKPSHEPSSGRNYEWSLSRRPAKKTVSFISNSKSGLTDSLPLKLDSNTHSALHYNESSS